MAGLAKDPNTHGELVSFSAADGVRLDGALFTNDRIRHRDIAIVSTHGSGGNFYSSVTGFLSPALPARGYPTLSMNLRCHDRFYASSIFEDCEKDLAAGIGFLKGQGYRRFVLFGHSLSVTQIIYYIARTQEPSVVGLALSAGHDDLRSIAWTNWDTLVPDPKGEYAKVLDECRALVARGAGDHLLIIPWWRPDPKLKLRQQYHEISAQSFLSYRAPESGCNASAWIGEVKTPMLLVAHSVVNTTANPEMMRRLRRLAIAPTEYVEIEGSGHFYAGYEDQLAKAVVDWLDRLPAA